MEQSVLSTTMAQQQTQGNRSGPLNGKDYVASMPKLSRGFSKVQANQDFVNETRNHIENNYKNLNDLNELNYLNKFLNNELTCYSFMLPNLNQFEDYKFREYLQNDLLEMPAQYNLTESGHLNWWIQNNWENVCRPLYPMITSGDGNCLLHAASLAMWGLHDRYLILRKALNSTLKQIKEDNTSPLWRRWKWEQMCQNRKYGLIYDEDEWAKEWHSLLKLSSYEPRVPNQQTTSSSCSSKQSNSNQRYSRPGGMDSNKSRESSSSVSSSSVKSGGHDPSGNNENGTCYFESLEEFHVFLLANILQRPIIIVSDTMLHDLNGDPLSPIPFGGIYLPFECELSKCHRYPLVLAYDSAHFSALVLMDEDENPNDNDQAINEHNKNQPDFDPDCILTNEEINQINKKLQLKPPYSIIPIQYSNKEILPVHFAYDPGEGYDWSKFPMRTPTGPNHQTSTNSINSSSNDNMSVSSANNNAHKGNGSNHHPRQTSVVEQQSEGSIEISRSEKMFIIQKYLDICKLELYDPGPLSKRNTQVFNSNGMCASIHNIQVPEPLCLNGQDIKAAKSKSTSKLQKFFSNLFKKGGDDVPTTPNKKINNNTSERNSNSIFASKLRKSLRNNYTPDSKNTKSTLISISTNPQFQTNLSPSSPPSTESPSKSTTLPSKLKSTGSLSNAGAHSPSSPTTLKTATTLNKLAVATTNTNTVFHKVQTFKNWNSLFNTLDNNANSFMAVKLNLAKPPRFNQVIHNYIESAKHRIEMMKQHHKMQLLHQQQQHQLYLQQQMQQKDMQMRQNQQHQMNRHNQQQQQQQQHQTQYHQQQQQRLKTREVFEEQHRPTPRYITTNSGNTRQMFNTDQEPNYHHQQQQQKQVYHNTQYTNNISNPGPKSPHEQQHKSRQSGPMYDEKDLEVIQHL